MMRCVTFADHFLLCLKGKSTDDMMFYSVQRLNCDAESICEVDGMGVG